MADAAPRFRDDAPVVTPPVALDVALASTDAALAVRLAPDDEARALIPILDRVALIDIAFPTFRDGRGYSAASMLREAGYRGELRASGDVLVDQIAFMRRCGFDSFAPDAPVDPDTLARLLSLYPRPYQPAADAALPVWRLRHG